VNERVFAEVEDLVDAAPVGEVTLQGFVKPMAAYGILEFKAAPGSEET
jgi:hypothetical protein